MNKFKLLTYIDGLFFALMVSTAESYALFYHTKNGLGGMELALISTFPIFFAAISQVLIPKFVTNKNISFALLLAMGMQVISLLGIFLSTNEANSFWLLMVSLSLYWVGGQNAGLFWLDFTSNYIPKDEYPRYMTNRNIFVVLFTMVFYLLFSYLLEDLESFKILFLIGLVARTISIFINIYIIYLSKKSKSAQSKTHDQGHKDSKPIHQLINRFLIWGGLFRISVNLSSPFFIVYMVNDLNLSTPDYVWLTAAPFLGRALFLSNWQKASLGGRFYFGSQVAVLFIAFLPIGWTFSSNFFYLIILQLMSGLFWGGLELTQVLMFQEHYYGNTRKILGIQQAIFTTCAMLGAGIGGYLIEKGITIDNIFEISTIARYIVAIALVYNLRSFNVSKLSFKEGRIFLFSVLSLRPSLVNTGRVLFLKNNRAIKLDRDD